MARKRYGLTETRIARYIKEGRGQGTGAKYKPWFTVGDVPSRGRVHRFFCPKVGREVHLLSDNEYFAFISLWWDDKILDIREQFPLLDRKETYEIAAQCGVKHPVDRRTGTLWVNSTDLLVTKFEAGQHKYLAYAVKEASELTKKRTVEKLEIERAYWSRRNVEWLIITNEQVKNTFTENISWILDPRQNSLADRDEQIIDGVLSQEIFRASSDSPSKMMRHLCLEIDNRLRLRDGTTLRSVRRLLGSKRMSVDLKQPRLPDLPASAYSFVQCTRDPTI